MLEFSDKEFETTMINILRTIMGKVGNLQEQMDNVSRGGNSKKKKEMLEIKNIVTEMNSYDGICINTLDVAGERISELEDMIIETFK